MTTDKFNLLQFLANFFLILVLAILFALFLVLAFHLPELGEKLNSLY